MPRADLDTRRAHTRAVNRASSALRKRYPDDYHALYDAFFREALLEAQGHTGLRFKTGPRSSTSPGAPLVQPPAPPGQCPTCQATHAGGHVCPDCGADLATDPSKDHPPGGFDVEHEATLRRMLCEHCGRDGRWKDEPCVERLGRRDRRYVSHQYVLQRLVQWEAS